MFNAIAFKNEAVTHVLTDRLYRAMVLHAATEKCGFHTNKPVFANWMAPEPVESPELVERANEILLDGYAPLLKEITLEDCREWRRVMIPRDVVRPQDRFDVVAARGSISGKQDAA
ncbi:MAG: hypothetical protein AAGC96_10075 [Pseudomonadota bacterium]